MTTAHFRSESNRVTVTDKHAVAEILEEYDFPPEIDPLLKDDTFQIITNNDMPNHGFKADKLEDGEWEMDVTVELYERLAEYFTEPLKVNTVQTHGYGNSNATRTVYPDGEIEREVHTPESNA